MVIYGVLFDIRHKMNLCLLSLAFSWMWTCGHFQFFIEESLSQTTIKFAGKIQIFIHRNLFQSNVIGHALFVHLAVHLCFSASFLPLANPKEMVPMPFSLKKKKNYYPYGLIKLGPDIFYLVFLYLSCIHTFFYKLQLCSLNKKKGELWKPLQKLTALKTLHSVPISSYCAM